MVNDWRRPVAEAVVTAYVRILKNVKEGEERRLRGCGEMGSCHLNLNAEARLLALYVKALVEAKA